jgi:hypothetical protein
MPDVFRRRAGNLEPCSSLYVVIVANSWGLGVPSPQAAASMFLRRTSPTVCSAVQPTNKDSQGNLTESEVWNPGGQVHHEVLRTVYFFEELETQRERIALSLEVSYCLTPSPHRLVVPNQQLARQSRQASATNDLPRSVKSFPPPPGPMARWVQCGAFPGCSTSDLERAFPVARATDPKSGGETFGQFMACGSELALPRTTAQFPISNLPSRVCVQPAGVLSPVIPFKSEDGSEGNLENGALIAGNLGPNPGFSVWILEHHCLLGPINDGTSWWDPARGLV